LETQVLFPPIFRAGSLLHSCKIPCNREQPQIWGMPAAKIPGIMGAWTCPV